MKMRKPQRWLPKRSLLPFFGASIVAWLVIILHLIFIGQQASRTERQASKSITDPIVPPIAASVLSNIVMLKPKESGIDKTTTTHEEYGVGATILSILPPELQKGNWIMGDANDLLARLKLKYPNESLELLAERAEFGSLNVCSSHHQWYACQDNPSCIEKDTCQHKEGSLPVEFRGSFSAGFRFNHDAQTRRELLTEMIDRMDRTVGNGMLKRDGYILLMTLNSGFSFLFGNWLCSLTRFNISMEDVRSRTLVLPRDEDARKFVETMGFFTPTADELRVLSNWTGRGNRSVSLLAAEKFAQGEHRNLNLFFKFGMPLDLLEMNMTVFMQDVDLIWFRNPLPIIQQQCEMEDCHGMFIAEARPLVGWFEMKGNHPWREVKPPIMQFNTGLFMLRPHVKVKHFMRILMHGVHLQQWKSRDQLYYNTVAWHRHFHDMQWRILSDLYYIPGSRLHSRILERVPLKPVNELAVLHVSDTANYADKIKRLRTLGHWYFTRESCPLQVETCRSIASCWWSVGRSCAACVE